MGKILIRFWLQRFIVVLVTACVGLSVAELIKQAGESFSYLAVLGWSAMAAMLASSIATYWAYKRQCRLVFKDAARPNKTIEPTR